MSIYGMDSDAVRSSAGKIDSLNTELNSIVSKLTDIMNLIEEKCTGQLGTEFSEYYQTNILTELKEEIESFRRVVQSTNYAANNNDDTTATVSSNIKRGI